MKRIVIVALALAAPLPLLLGGCAIVSPTSTSGGPSEPIVSLGITFTTDDFAADAHPVKDVTLDYENYFTVTLDANHTTGYDWNADAFIDGNAVVQVSHEYQEPDTELVGAPGKDVWTFRAARADVATLSFSYSRPWESMPPTWTLTVNVTVQ